MRRIGTRNRTDRTRKPDAHIRARPWLRMLCVAIALVLVGACAAPTLPPGTPTPSPAASPAATPTGGTGTPTPTGEAATPSLSPPPSTTPIQTPTPKPSPTPAEPTPTPFGPTVAPDPNLAEDAAFRLLRILPKRSDSVLINPGKGWILYDNAYGDFSQQTEATWAYGSVGYARLAWSNIEKSDGVYDWSVIDKGLAQCKLRGKGYVFGVMACDPTSPVDYTTPKFILDRPDVNSLVLSVPNYSMPDPNEPGGYRKMMKHVVDYTDPGEGYYLKLEQFAEALAERYGNDPAVEYIDIRSFGSWGENSHAWLYGSDEEGYDEGICDDRYQHQGVDPEVMKRCWSTYIDAFRGKRARLVTAWGFGCNQCMNYTQKEPYYWAVSQGVALRRDGYSGYGQGSCQCREVLWGVNQVPLILEMASSYQYQKTSLGFDAARLLESPEQNRASYYALGTYNRDGSLMLKELKDAIDAVTNRIGYHFRLEEALVTEGLGKGKTGTIAMKWTNDGVAKLFMESHVGLALLDGTGAVADRCWLEGVDPRTWVCAMDMVTEDRTNHAEATFRFDRAAKEGTYRLAIGLFTDRSLERPNIRIGNAGETETGWTVLYDEAAPAEAETDWALHRPATSSSRLSATTDAGNAVRHGAGYWSSGEGKTEWLSVDLGTVRTVRTLTLDWGRRYASAYRVQVSLQAPGSADMGWKDVYAATDGTGGRETIGFAPVSARTVRVLCTASATAPYAHDGIGPFPGENLLENSGFEAGLSAWRDYVDTRATINETRFDAGSKALDLKGAKLNQIRQSLTSAFELTGPGRYRVSFRAYTEGTDQAATLEIGVKGSEDDQTDVHWWAPKTRVKPAARTALKRNEWTTVEWEGDVSWNGLMEMGYLLLEGYSPTQVNLTLDSVRIEKVSAINGERQEKWVPKEGRYTIRSLRIR